MAERKTVFKSQMSCCKKHSLNQVSADNGRTAFIFMDEEFLRICELFLPNPSEISSNEKIETYPFFKHKSNKKLIKNSISWQPAKLSSIFSYMHQCCIQSLA